MLYVTFVNLSDLASVSDYRVEVFVNMRRIDGPFIVRGHKRSDGYETLVRKFITEPKEKHVIEKRKRTEAIAPP